MKLTKLSAAVLAAGMMMSAAAQAEEASGPFSVSGNVAMTTDYFYRGITQSDSSAALQGTISISHESGFYLTVWGSSIDFASGLELDPAIGYAGEAGGVAYDVGILHYGYPGSTAEDAGAKYDFTEVYGSVAFGGAKFGVAYSPEFFGETGDSIYLNASYGMEVGGFGLSAAVGYNILDDEFYAEDTYVDYKLAVSKEVIGLGLELAFIGTDLDDNDEGVVFTVSKSF